MNISPRLLPPPMTTALSTSDTHRRSTRAAGPPVPLDTMKLGVRIGAADSIDPKTAPSPDNELDFSKGVIYGEVSVSPPSERYTLLERMQRVEDYTGRVVTQIENIENGHESERNVKFQNVRQFLEPAGYFSGGLLAGGYDPHEKFTVTFNSYVGKWKPEVKSNTDERTYYAWEIAAGALKHDRTPEGGLLNFQDTKINPQDQAKINDLEALGARLQAHWKVEIAEHMRDGLGPLAKRSGKADAYVVRGILNSLREDKDSFEKLPPAGQEAINRTLEKNGNVIIPNLYGYPLAGHAFIPYTNYHGDYDHRPNQGIMIDLKTGTLSEIYGDDDFAHWAEKNRNALQSSFNARDRQGGKDSHWPSATNVLDNLIDYTRAKYPGYESFFKDQYVPVRETFNYTQSRNSDYYLKWGDLNAGIASEYQAVNAKNAVWADQTEVFGSEQQVWKAAKELWGRTFGYVPVLGNGGNIYFGVHDSVYGMTADDRVGGTAAAVISSLQLVHELAPYGVETGLGEFHLSSNPASNKNYNWRYNAETREYEFVRAPKTLADNDTSASVNIETDESNNSMPVDGEGVHLPADGTDVKLPPLSSIENLPTGEALFSTGEKAVILSGQVDNLNVINEKLYTFVDTNKKNTEQRLNILVHGSFNPETGVAKVVYDGKLNTAGELLHTLHAKGIHPENFDNIRLLSCDSASGGDQSFAAQFQRLVRRPVKGYSGTLTANLAPENITAAIGKVEKVYHQNLQNNGIPLTPTVTKLARDQAEEYVSAEMKRVSQFRPAKNNPYWNPLKWWSFTYKPVTFTPQP